VAFYVARLVPPAVALHTPASGAGEAQRWAAQYQPTLLEGCSSATPIQPDL